MKLPAAQETPDIGGAAITSLTNSILENQSLEGVEAVSGATWTSNGVFGAIRSAMGEETAEDSDQALSRKKSRPPASPTGLGIYSNGRLGPGSDDQGVGVYSF